jgi:hypothetical protein
MNSHTLVQLIRILFHTSQRYACSVFHKINFSQARNEESKTGLPSSPRRNVLVEEKNFLSDAGKIKQTHSIRNQEQEFSSRKKKLLVMTNKPQQDLKTGYFGQ